MATLNEDIQEQLIERAIYLQRFGNGLSDEVLALLRKMERDIERKLQTIRGPLTKTILETRLIEIRRIIHGYSPRLEKLLERQLKKLARIEATYAASQVKIGLGNFGAGALAAGVTRPDLTTIVTATHARPFQGRLLREWIQELDAATARAVRNAVRIGYAEGETLEQIVRRVVGTRRLNYRDGVMEINRRNAEAIVRTAISHYSTHARQKVYDDLADMLEGVKWVSTLDSRTTPLCRSRDGQVYPAKSGPRPPAHINCRSTVVPIVKGADALGLPPATRASIDGQVPEDVTYGPWLRTRSRGFVEDVLGKTRAKLFLDGDLKIDRFVNPRGQTYTLDELKSLFPSAWTKAGLS